MKTFSITDIGMCRNMNQDYCYTSELPVGNLPNLFIVADGMGCHNAGEFASRYTVETMVQKARSSLQAHPSDIMEEAIKTANDGLIKKAAQEPAMWGMGTTVVAAVVAGGRLYVANVGDSRLYIVNDDILQVTKDHSYVEEMVRRGQLGREAARRHPDKNIITRAVGAVKDIQIDFFEEDIRYGDEILLCTDGLTNMIEDEDIRRIIKGQRDAAEKAECLVNTANQNGGRDNITVVVIDPLSGGT